MPTYSYTCMTCDKTLEQIVKMEHRDDQFCEQCGYKLIRGIDKPGMVWSPTRNGGYST